MKKSKKIWSKPLKRKAAFIISIGGGYMTDNNGDEISCMNLHEYNLYGWDATKAVPWKLILEMEKYTA